jgi:hypothetical protein
MDSTGSAEGEVMDKATCLKLRTGDVVSVSHGSKAELCTVTGRAFPSLCRGARIAVRRHRDGAEFTVYSTRIADVVSVRGMEATNWTEP